MVTPARFERTTYRLGGGCSILLSYGASLSVRGAPARPSITATKAAYKEAQLGKIRTDKKH